MNLQAAKQAMQRDRLHPEQPNETPEAREASGFLAHELISPRSQAANTSPKGFPSSVKSPRCFSAPAFEGTPRAASRSACCPAGARVFQSWREGGGGCGFRDRES